MIPWSSGSNFVVAFAGRNNSSVAFSWVNLTMCTTVIHHRSIFRFWEYKLRSNFVSQSVNSSIVIQAFLLAEYWTSNVLRPEKHRSFWKRPMVKSGIFSVPSEFMQRRKVILSLDFFPPWHFSDLNDNALSGKRRQKRPLSSALKMFFPWYRDKVGFRVLSVHAFVSCSFTEYRSPLLVLKTIACLL